LRCRVAGAGFWSAWTRPRRAGLDRDRPRDGSRGVRLRAVPAAILIGPAEGHRHASPHGVLSEARSRERKARACPFAARSARGRLLRSPRAHPSGEKLFPCHIDSLQDACASILRGVNETGSTPGCRVGSGAFFGAPAAAVGREAALPSPLRALAFGRAAARGTKMLTRFWNQLSAYSEPAPAAATAESGRQPSTAAYTVAHAPGPRSWPGRERFLTWPLAR
jgi:hypothetical protein